MRLPLLKDDIRYAIKQDRWNCAVVRAIQREIPNATFVRADREKIAFSIPEEGVRYEYNTPKITVERVIEPLDRGLEVKPQEIVLVGRTIRPIGHLTPEKKQALRQIDRERVQKSNFVRERGRARNRFCQPDEATES